MPHPLDPPRPDNRTPGYGCTLSFGMLGPSRIVVQWDNVPPMYNRFSGGICIPFSHDTVNPPQFQSDWTTGVGGDDANATLWCIDPITGGWQFNTNIYVTGPGLQAAANGFFTNFTWQFQSVHLNDQSFGVWGFARVYRIAEWQTVTERFPDVWFPEV